MENKAELVIGLVVQTNLVQRVVSRMGTANNETQTVEMSHQSQRYQTVNSGNAQGNKTKPG